MNVTAALFDLRPRLDAALLDKTKMLAADVLANQRLARTTDFGRVLSAAGDDSGVFAMAALAHSLELDDMHRASATHPGSAAVAAALHVPLPPRWERLEVRPESRAPAPRRAAAEQVRRPALAFSAGLPGEGTSGSRGRLVLDAVAYGVEITARVAEAFGGPALYERGYHPSSYCAAFGAAAASALLLGLNRERFTHALGLAGCQAAGLMCGVEQGPTSWYVQYGRAAAAGADAARWAAAGVTAPADILGGSRGLLEVFGRQAAIDRLLDPEPIGMPQLSFKIHACLFFGQAAVEATLEALAGASPDEVERAELFIPQQAYDVRTWDAYPQTRLAAQSDVRYLVAAAVRYARVTLEEFSPMALADLREPWERVTVAGRDSLSRLFPERWPAEVRLHLRDGSVRAATVESALGAPERPPTWDQLQAKAGLPPDTLALVRHLDEVSEVSALLDS